MLAERYPRAWHRPRLGRRGWNSGVEFRQVAAEGGLRSSADSADYPALEDAEEGSDLVDMNAATSPPIGKRRGKKSMVSSDGHRASAP